MITMSIMDHVIIIGATTAGILSTIMTVRILRSHDGYGRKALLVLFVGQTLMLLCISVRRLVSALPELFPDIMNDLMVLPVTVCLVGLAWLVNTMLFTTQYQEHEDKRNGEKS